MPCKKAKRWLSGQGYGFLVVPRGFESRYGSNKLCLLNFLSLPGIDQEDGNKILKSRRLEMDGSKIPKYRKLNMQGKAMFQD